MPERVRGPFVEVLPSDKDFQYWLSRSYVGDDLRRNLSRADVLIVPFESFHGVQRPLFAHQTHELMSYLQAEAKGRFSPDICIEDSDYAEVVLHGTDLSLPSIIVVSLLAPLVVNLITEYISRCVFRRKVRADATQVHFTLSLTGPGRTLDLKYDGPANQFKEAIGHKVLELQEANQKHEPLPRSTDGNDVPGHSTLPK